MNQAQNSIFSSNRPDTDCIRWKFEEIFSTPGAVNLDVGFGSGESLLGMAKMHPDENFIGIEVPMQQAR